MIVRYDSLNRYETPHITMCNPGSTYTDGRITNAVGFVPDVSDMELVFNFNSTSELNFRITKIKRDNSEDNAYTFKMYKGLQNRRLLFVEDIGYFAITNVDDSFDGVYQYKDIQAESVDAELRQKMLPYIPDNTYRFSTSASTGEIGLLEQIVSTLSLWTIGYVDPSVAAKYRTFEDVSTDENCLAFMLEEMQDAYECIFVYDIINRVINVYDQNNYVRDTNVHITKDDVINSLNITENAEDLYTAIRVLGGDNITIGAVNPTGDNVIYNFDHYIDWMPEALGEKVLQWKQDVEDAEPEYYEHSLTYYELLADDSNYEQELSRTQIQINMYQRCKDNIIAEAGKTDLVGEYNEVIAQAGGAPIVVYPEIADTINGIQEIIDECKAHMAEVQAQRDALADSLYQEKQYIGDSVAALALTNYFDPIEMAELNNYIYEGSYKDDYVVVTDIMTHAEQFDQMSVLFNRAKQQLEKVSKPTQEFSIDAENFIFVKEFEHWSDQLETGCLINVELDVNDVAKLFLSNMTINYEDHSLSFTFGNRFNKFDPRSLFEDVLGNVSKSANTLGYIKDILYPIKNGEFDKVKEALQTSRNLTMGSALTSSDQAVLIDASGYTGRRINADGVVDPRQVKIVNNNIVFTDDAWETSKVAIGEIVYGEGETRYGINAEIVHGDLLMGNGLRIINEEGQDLLTIMDDKIQTKVGDSDNRITELEQNANSIDIRIQNIENAPDIDSITTATGFTFNQDGLNISKDGDEMKNLLDSTGMYVTRSGDAILTANNEGVEAINLTANQYLTIGLNSRFEDYTDGNGMTRTACFYIGTNGGN